MKTQAKGELVWNERQGGYVPKLSIAENGDASCKLRLNFMVQVNNALKGTADPGTTAHIAKAYENSLLRRAQMLQ